MNAPLLAAALLAMGDSDGDPSDWSGAPWIVIAVVVVAVVVVGGVVLARWRTHHGADE